MKNRFLQGSDEQDVFTDLLFNALLGFAFMFAIAFMLINNSEDSGKIESKAEILISVSWPDDHPDDVERTSPGKGYRNSLHPGLAGTPVGNAEQQIGEENHAPD